MLRRLANLSRDLRARPLLIAVATLPFLAIGLRASSELIDAPQRRELSQPWALGGPASIAVPMDARGGSRIEWSAERPVGIGMRHELADGIALHVGAEALADAQALEALEVLETPETPDADARLPAWQAGAAVRVRLDDHWNAGVGAGWRSIGRSGGSDWTQDADARETGEGVIWFGLSGTF